MSVFQHILWGYEITYPATWFHRQAQDVDVFLASPDALDPGYDGPDAGQVQVRGEWNWARQDVQPLWNQHIGKLAGMLGASQVGSAPWRIGDATGLEAEIVLPKKDNRRLWTGILARDFRVLHLMVTHPREAREHFEPLATQIIASLRFPQQIAGVETTPEGLPLPPGCTPADPRAILPDIQDPQSWRAYAGSAGAGALQAFYLRELPLHGWAIEEYVPYPGPELGFARFKLRREKLQVTLGIMPGDDTANVVYRINNL